MYGACDSFHKILLCVIHCVFHVYVGSWHQASTALHAPFGAITQTASSDRSMPEMRPLHSAHWKGRCSPLKVATFALIHSNLYIPVFSYIEAM